MLTRFILLFTLLILGAWLGSWFLPWWFASLLALALGIWRPLPGFTSFFCGALALSLLWMGQIYVINSANEGLLLGRMQELFKPLPLYWITVLIGFLSGGLGMLTGALARQAFFPEEEGGRRRRRR